MNTFTARYLVAAWGNGRYAAASVTNIPTNDPADFWWCISNLADHIVHMFHLHPTEVTWIVEVREID